MTPAQVVELHQSRNVRGQLIDGERGPTTIFAVIVQYATYSRAQELTKEKATPDTLVWYTAYLGPTHVEVHTNRPEWFVEMEEMIDASRRQPYR